MRTRYGEQAGAYGEPREIDGVKLRLVPAGHILGSAQVVLEWRGRRVVVSGDYKRAPDPTCAPFELVACDLFVTEATFALPVFRHEPADREIDRLLGSPYPPHPLGQAGQRSRPPRDPGGAGRKMIAAKWAPGALRAKMI